MICLLDASLSIPASMWQLSRPWGEFVLRALLVYVAVLVVFRLQGKREVGQLAPFDLVLLLLVSNAVQNAMNAGDNTVGGGLILLVALAGAHAVTSFLSARSKRLERALQGQPRLLVHHGIVNEAALAAEGLTHHELMAALRQAGLSSPLQVHAAILEPSGRIDILPRKEGQER